MKRSLYLLTTGLGALVAVVASLGSFTACSSSSSPGSSGGGGGLSSFPIAGPDVPLPAGVTLQPDVVMVHGGASVLKALSDDHGVWTIDKNADGVSGLAPGKVLLIAGLDCARVTDMKDNGDGTLDVTIAPVAITDVIQEGSLDFQSQSIDMSQGVLGQAPYAVVVDSEATDAGTGDAGSGDGGAPDGDAGCADGGADGGGSCSVYRSPNLHLAGLGGNPSNSVTVNMGNWSIQFTGNRTGDGLTINVTAQFNAMSTLSSVPNDPAQTLGGISTGINVGVTINNLKSASGSLHVSGGKITDSNLTADVSGSADMSANMSTMKGSQFPKQALVKLPLSVEYPFYWGPIPMYLSGTIAFLIQPSLATQNSVLGLSGHLDFSGNAGVAFTSGTASPAAAPMVTPPANPLDTATTPPEIGTMAAVFAVQAPRIGFGIGSTAFAVGAKAGIFVDVVNSFGLVVASATSLVPCRSAYWTAVSHGGGEMAIQIGGTSVGITHQIDLVSIPEQSWYTPMVAACKP
jgi:hypothetical protein